MRHNRQKGNEYEQLAKQYLKKQGLKPFADNYFCRFGEIDLIMSDSGTICFIEVKFRQRDDFGGSAYSIPTSKIQKLSNTALHFMSRQPNQRSSNYRFDALLISPVENDIHYQWIKNCFEVAGDGYF